jgi:hypothetical protein
VAAVAVGLILVQEVLAQAAQAAAVRAVLVIQVKLKHHKLDRRILVVAAAVKL